MRRVLTNCLLFCGLAAMVAGCSKTDSSNIKTSGIFATYKVSSSGSATAEFHVGSESGTVIQLSGTDVVKVNNKTMTQTGILGNVTYEASLTGLVALDTVTFTLTRDGEDPHISTVSIPADINGTVGSPTITNGHTLDVGWDSANDSMSIELNKHGGGVDQSLSPSDSSGIDQFSGNQTTISGAGPVNATVEFTRTKTGTLSADFGGGSIKSTATDSVDVELD